jgi:hypothetical protein
LNADESKTEIQDRKETNKKQQKTCSTIKTSSLLFSQLLDSIQRENMSRLKQPPNDLPVAPQGERTSNLLGRYYTLASPPQETRQLKTVNSGTIQGKFTEIRSKEERKQEAKTRTNNNKTKEQNKKLTEDLQFKGSSSRLQAPTGGRLNNVRRRRGGKM